MNLLLNIIWMIFGGIISWIVWTFAGLILCITIIGIPFGKQAFKCARLSLAPFGKKVDLSYMRHPIANTIWLIFFGWEIFIAYIFGAFALCVTIIGIPIGLQVFKFAKIGLAPFGSKIK